MLNSDVICKPTRKPGSSRPVSPSRTHRPPAWALKARVSPRKPNRLKDVVPKRLPPARAGVVRRRCSSRARAGDRARSTDVRNRCARYCSGVGRAKVFHRRAWRLAALSTPPTLVRIAMSSRKIDTSAGPAPANSCTRPISASCVTIPDRQASLQSSPEWPL